MNSPAFSATYSTLFAFDLHQIGDYAGVVEGTGTNQGSLFGTTDDTSLSYGGSIYKVAMTGGAPQVIYQLKETDGYAPEATLLASSDGNLYGSTRYAARTSTNLRNGFGTVFRVGQNGTGFTTLHIFSAPTSYHPVTLNPINADGIFPDQALIESGAYVYGVTSQGGLYGSGTVFRIRKSDGVFDVLHHFAAVDATGLNSTGEGAHPNSPLTLASDGRLYGVTSVGGANLLTSGDTSTTGTGTIYSLNPDGTGFQTNYNFSALDGTQTLPVNGDGAQPGGKLVEAGSGVLIGTTRYGGTPTDPAIAGFGTVFSFDTATGDLSTLYNFDYNTGAAPRGNLVRIGNRIYGMTTDGSSTATPATVLGAIFGINVDGSGFSVEHALVFTEGSTPTDGVILGSNGDLFGAVKYGNACAELNGSGYGGVFRYSVTTNGSSSGYSNCTTFDSSSGGGGFSPGFLWLLSALGLAPPVRRRLFGVRR